MARPECPPAESIVRAITTAYWDPNEGRIASSLFKGAGTSVSRLAVLALDDLFEIFNQQLHRPPNISLLAAGEINVGSLQRIGWEYRHSTELTVEEAPLPSNPAHAEIPQRISRGLSKSIITALDVHEAHE